MRAGACAARAGPSAVLMKAAISPATKRSIFSSPPRACAARRAAARFAKPARHRLHAVERDRAHIVLGADLAKRSGGEGFRQRAIARGATLRRARAGPLIQIPLSAGRG